MNDMKLGESMFDKATAFIARRYPTGWGGCAVMYTEEGNYLISVYLESPNSSAGLCMETGAMCEAQKYNLKITHTMCVSREDETAPFLILTPCGICQERLRYWGGNVKAAVTNPETKILFKTLDELSGHYWAYAYPDREEYSPGIYLKRGETD